MKEMKKIIYIITAGLLVLAVACNKTMDVDSSSNTTTVPPAEGTMVKVEFDVSYPGSSAQTKAAMGEVPVIDTLFIAIFSEDNGYLQNWIPATLEKIASAGVNVKAKYKVYLPITNNEVFHFIANPPDRQPAFDYENSFVRSMVTTDSEGAYWQRITISGGVKAAKDDNGEYILDDNGNYTVDYDSIEDLKHVVLVRNYAKIVVKSAVESEFKVVQYALGYVPTSGTVAPWNTKTSSGNVIGFDVKYTDIKDYLPQDETIHEGDDTYDSDLHRKGRFYEDLTLKDASGYTGYSGVMPDNVVFNNDEPTSFVYATATDNGLYTYERTMPNSTDQLPTVIVMQIEWQDGNSLGVTAGTPDWYKVELLDNDGDFMPLLRNIRYTLSLSGIKERGYSTSTLAWENSALGNISSSLETAALNDISDGTSRLIVEQLDYSIFTNITNTTLEFQFYPDESSNTTVNKTSTDDNVAITISLRTVDGYEAAVTAVGDLTEVEHTDGTTWGSIPLTIANVPASGMLKSVIRVQGRYGSNRPIYRDVTYSVQGQQSLTSKSSVAPASGSTDIIDQPVIVTIGIPENLASDIFPLQFRIEALDNNLSATDPELPVVDGLSTFTFSDTETGLVAKKDPGTRSFYYIKTISYTDYRKYDYDQQKYVYTTEWPCTLYTTKTSGNGTTVRISFNDDDQADWLFAAKDFTLSF